jgi:cystine transport system substrate-binding protein
MAALAACGGGSSTTGSSGGSSGSSKSSGSSGEALTVGTEGTYSPFTFHDPKTNKLTGYDVEVVEAVAGRLGRPVKFSESTFDAIFAGLEASRYDVVANQISVNPERQAKYAFSQPYTVSEGVVVTRADDTSVHSHADVRGKTSAQSVTSNFAATARKAGAKVEAVEGFTQAVALLKQKRVDITINDNLAVLDYLRTSGDKGVKIAARTGDRTEQAFAFRKDSPLPTQFDQALTKLRADGTLAKISQKWFGEDVSKPAAS